MAFKDYFKRNLKNVVQEQQSRLGALAAKDEVAFTDLAAALQAVINGKADAATTLAGYGITDAMTATEINAAISSQIGSTYRPAGTIAGSELVAALLIEGNAGKVYNVSSDLAITAENEALFANLSAGDKVKAGDDVGIIEVEDGESTSYLFNDFAGFVDLSGYSTTAEMNSAIATAIADKIELTDLTGTVTGSGNVVTSFSYDNTTGEFTATKGDTAVMASELVDLTAQEIDDLFTAGSGE